jgi:nucleotide-binding universal stress UspA family protein
MEPALTVVAVVDATAAGRTALEWGARIARSSQGRLRVLHVLGARRSFGLGPGTGAAAARDAWLDSADALHLECELLLAGSQLDWTFEVAELTLRQAVRAVHDRDAGALVVIGPASTRRRIRHRSCRLLDDTRGPIVVAPSAGPNRGRGGGHER